MSIGSTDMSTKFIREERYTVLKTTDVQCLHEDEQKQLAAIAAKVALWRTANGKAPLECVVVERDWPEYEPTWKGIEARVSGQPVEVVEPVPPSDENITDAWVSASDSDGIAYDGPSFERGYRLGRGDYDEYTGALVAAARAEAIAAAPKVAPLTDAEVAANEWRLKAWSAEAALAAAKAAQPLDLDVIHELWYKTQGDAEKFTRAIEAAIGGQPSPKVAQPLTDEQIDVVLKSNGWMDDAIHNDRRKAQIRNSLRRTLNEAAALYAAKDVSEQTRLETLAAMAIEARKTQQTVYDHESGRMRTIEAVQPQAPVSMMTTFQLGQADQPRTFGFEVVLDPALAPDGIQLVQPPAQDGSELEAFNAWFLERKRRTFPKDYDISRLSGWAEHYRPEAWGAWQARAAYRAPGVKP
jgi:hypothetical protein